jgi:hypothetical protein
MPFSTLVLLVALALPLPAYAFSPQLEPGESESGTTVEPAVPPLGPVTPGVAPPAPDDATGDDDTDEPPTIDAPSASPEQPSEAPAAGLPTILRLESDMPEPVRQTRQKLIDAARSGDIEQLRALMKAQPEPPSVSLGDPGDPIDYLKALSSDAEGREILAILLEVLESGFVHSQPGTANELYVWPYFAEYPLDALTPPQLVELFTLLTAADYEDMRSYGSYTFFRVGIAPDGRWLFFLAGD